MTYTKQVREYCLNNQGTVLDVSLMKDSEFSEIPYKTLLKILNRLEEEKLIADIFEVPKMPTFLLSASVL